MDALKCNELTNQDTSPRREDAAIPDKDPNIAIREAVAGDEAELTDIAFAAKAHWGYPPEWLEMWADELTVGPEYLRDNAVFVAQAPDRIAGWCSLTEDGGHWLDYCWVRPRFAGRGTGRLLVCAALEAARARGATSLRVVADPNAEGFYTALRFTRTGFRPSVPAGRRLPILTRRV